MNNNTPIFALTTISLGLIWLLYYVLHDYKRGFIGPPIPGSGRDPKAQKTA